VSGLVQATRALVERLKTKACQPRDEGENPMHSDHSPFVKMCESMLEIVLFLWEIGKEQETEGDVLTDQFWPTDATRSQHMYRSAGARRIIHHVPWQHLPITLYKIRVQAILTCLCFNLPI